MKAIVLASGGIDSATCVALAIQNVGKQNVVIMTVDYGQRNSEELSCVNAVAAYYGVEKCQVNLADVFKFSDSTLLAHSEKAMVKDTYANQVAKGKVSSCVPFRNGVFVSTAAALAQSLFSEEKVTIYVGSLGTSGSYPDCSVEFIMAMTEAVKIGTYGQVSVVFPLAGKSKAAVVAYGIQLKVPFQLTRSCYDAGDKPCGECATCRERREAFELNGITDPAEYAEVAV